MIWSSRNDLHEVKAMTRQRQNSQPKPVVPQNSLQLADGRDARRESTLPKDGIRPTREGPWDPCRFQEYEVSPEFRRQIMLVKPPPADPRLFQDTLPPKDVSELTSSTEANQNLGASLPTEELPVSSEQTPTPSVRRRGRIIAILVVSGALLGLISGYSMSQLKIHGTKMDSNSVEIGNSHSK